MAWLVSCLSTTFSLQTHAIASIPHCKQSHKAKKSLDFHTGERILEIRAMNGKDWGLKWRTQMQNVCNMRERNRGPLWRGRPLSIESMQAVQAMKRAKGNQGLIDKVLQTKVSRLVKADLLAVLAELQRQEECALALLVFEAVRKEAWYKPDVLLYTRMVNVLKRNGLIEKVEPLFTELKKELNGPTRNGNPYTN